METLIGIVGKDFVLMAADANSARSIVLMRDDVTKIRPLDDNKLLAAVGDPADRDMFCEYVEKNMKLYRLRTGISLSTSAAAHWTRRQLATALRKGPYQTDLLIGGFDAAPETERDEKDEEVFFFDRNRNEMYCWLFTAKLKRIRIIVFSDPILSPGITRRHISHYSPKERYFHILFHWFKNHPERKAFWEPIVFYYLSATTHQPFTSPHLYFLGTPVLYYMDYLASMNQLNFAVHGYGSFFCLGVMDKYYKKDMTLEEALDLLKNCIWELKTRFIVKFPRFYVKIVDHEGVRDLDEICL